MLILASGPDGVWFAALLAPLSLDGAGARAPWWNSAQELIKHESRIAAALLSISRRFIELPLMDLVMQLNTPRCLTPLPLI